ncbi:MAG: DUF87 domain-containing protein [Planctomycetes bacterium]|nr:DUF87 domain-containing protein [Planctomycetota bacterium]
MDVHRRKQRTGADDRKATDDITPTSPSGESRATTSPTSGSRDLNIDLAAAARRRTEAGRPAAPDFEQLTRGLQRLDMERAGVALARSAPAPSAVVDGCLCFAPTDAPPHAVALTRVRGLSQPPATARRPKRKPPPLGGQVLSGLCKHDANVLFLLHGEGSDVRLFMGAKAQGGTREDAAERAAKAFDSLRTCLVATYADIRLEDLKTPREYQALRDAIGGLRAAASLLGNPSAPPAADPARTTMDRVIEALVGARYAYFVEAHPVDDETLGGAFQETTHQIADVHQYVKWTASGSKTSTSQEAHEQFDRFAQQYEDLLESACRKLDAGLREGMWRTSATLLAATEEECSRAGALLRAVFAGPRSLPEPVKVLLHSKDSRAIAPVAQFCSPRAGSGGPQSDGDELGTLLCSSDAGLLVDLPRKEAAGFHVGQPREFALDVEAPAGAAVEIGPVLGRAGPTNRVFGIELDDMTRHALIVGVTGAGKTNTAMHLLHELWGRHHIPFLVIEPAKAQYRNLLGVSRFRDVQIFAPGYRDIAPLRLNPFEFPPGIDVQTHITHLYAVFNAAFILYAPMPYVLERAMYELYEERGWDLAAGRHPEADARTQAVSPLAFPTLSDLYSKIKDVVDRLGYDDRIRMDVTAGLQARVDSLRVGQKGQTFDTRRSVPFERLLEKPTILELSHIGSDEEKAFFMGLLLTRLYETREAEGESPGLRHVTFIEEAHRLLSRTSTDTSATEVANVKGKAVETFCNMLAEVRAYGEGIAVMEQIPNKLAEDLLKNTNLKVMHRIVAADDRAVMGGTMNLQPAQQGVITTLARGEAAVYAEGLERPALVKVPLCATCRAVTHADVRRQSQVFYREFRDVLGGMAGCRHCAEVCRFGALARRLVDRSEACTTAWSFAVSCLRSPAAAKSAWEQFGKRLIPRSALEQVTPADRSALLWCACHTAGERAFWELRRRGAVSLVQIESLLTTFANLCHSVAEGHADTAARHSQYRARAQELLKLAEGPYRGCVQCRSRCTYGPLGQRMSSNSRLRDGLGNAFTSKDPKRTAGEFCRSAAAEVLMTDDRDAVQDLAVCLCASVAERVGARDPAGMIANVFGGKGGA